MAAGWGNKEIAARLGVTTWTIEKHLRELFCHYRVPNRAALVRVALRTGALTDAMVDGLERRRSA